MNELLGSLPLNSRVMIGDSAHEVTMRTPGMIRLTSISGSHTKDYSSESQVMGVDGQLVQPTWGMLCSKQ